jgi:alkaline phosphatase
VFTIGGYPVRGNPILGLAQGVGEKEPTKDLLGLPYTTLSYANGPGYTGESNQQAAGSKLFTTPATQGWASGSESHTPTSYKAALGRPDLSKDTVENHDYLQESTVPMGAETHAAEDVAIFAKGPQAHLFHGIVEQNVIYHVMAEALGLPKHHHYHSK